MGSNTKIVVFKAKELIYTLIFVVFGILLLILLIYMFSSKQKGEQTVSANPYIPGVYSSTIQLGDSSFDVQVTVDSDTISSVSLVNLESSVTTMYPLLAPTVDEINQQISTIDSIDDIQYSSNNQYTAILLNRAIKNALTQAQATTD